MVRGKGSVVLQNQGWGHGGEWPASASALGTVPERVTHPAPCPLGGQVPPSIGWESQQAGVTWIGPPGHPWLLGHLWSAKRQVSLPGGTRPPGSSSYPALLAWGTVARDGEISSVTVVSGHTTPVLGHDSARRERGLQARSPVCCQALRPAEGEEKPCPCQSPRGWGGAQGRALCCRFCPSVAREVRPRSRCAPPLFRAGRPRPVASVPSRSYLE